MNDPLIEAVIYEEDSEKVEELLKNGVDVNKQAEEQGAGGEGRWVAGKGDTALHVACGGELTYWPVGSQVVTWPAEPDDYYVKKLLKHGARINIKNNKGQTALDVAHKALKRYKANDDAVARVSEKRCEEIISMLLHPVKQRLAFMRAMNNYNLDLDVLNKIGEMHLSLHE